MNERTRKIAVIIGVTSLIAGAATIIAQRYAGAERAKRENPFIYRNDDSPAVNPALLGYAEMESISLQSSSLKAIAVDSQDRLYVVSDSKLLTYGLNFQPLASFDIQPNCGALTVATDGIIYTGCADRIFVYDPAGRLLSEWTSLGAEAVITSLAVNAERLYIADYGNRAVWIFSRDGALIKKLIGRPGEADSYRFIVPSPYFDVAIDARGLWVVNPGKQEVALFTLAGDWISSWGQHAVNNALDGFCGCCNPTHLAILPDGGLVTSEKGIARVKVSDLTGRVLSVVASANSFEDRKSVV